MIEIIERKGWIRKSPFSDTSIMHPVYMIKDGKEYFVVNRPEPEKSWEEKKRKAQIEELIANDGTHFHFCGAYADPFEMLKEMTERGHTFCNPDKLFDDCRNDPSYGAGFVDFHGNRNEFSAAFYYRIYDEVLLERIKEATAPIIARSKQK